MTQPDQYFPGAATNVSDPGFSSYTQKTQADYEAQQKSPWGITLAPLADLCTLVTELPIVSSIMALGHTLFPDAGNTSNILHGIQDTINQLSQLICVGIEDIDVDVTRILDGANAILAAAEANPFYAIMLDVAAAIEGASGNVIIDVINGINYWLGDIITFLGNPAGLGSGIITGVIPALRIAGLDASKIISGQFAQTMVTNLVTDLAGLGGDFSTVATDLQTVIDGIYQAVHGGSTINNLPSTVKTALLNFPGVNIVSAVLASVVPSLDATKITTGTFTTGLIPSLDASKITSGIFNVLRIPSLDAAQITTGTFLAGLIPGLDATKIITGVFTTGLIPSLDASKITSGVFGTARVDWAAPIDTLVQAWGGSGTGHTTTDLTSFAQSIGTGFVQGVSGLGGANVGATIGNGFDALVQAIQNNTATGNSFAVVQGAMAALRGFLGYTPGGSPAATSVAGIANAGSAFIANTAVTKPIGANIDPTMIGVFNLNDLKTATLTTVACTQGATLIGFINAPEGATKQSIQWLGFPTGGNFNNISDIRLNIYKMVSGVSTFVYQTPNIVGSVASGSSPVWNAFNLSSGNYVTVAQGDVYAVELQIIGTGTYNVVGVTSTIPQHLTAVPAMSGATRNNVTGYGGTAPVLETQASSAGGANSITWTHTFNGNESFLLVPTTYSQAAGGGTYAVTVGGRTCTSLSNNVFVSGSGINVFYLYPPTGQATFTAGAQTVSVSLSGFAIGGASYGFSNCVGWNTSPITSANSGAVSQSITGKASSRILQVISGFTSTISAYNQTQLFNQAWVSGQHLSMLVGHMAGVSGTVTGSATLSAATTWGSTMIELIPPTPPTSIAAPGGSSAFQYSTKTPFFGLSGAAGQTQYPPQLIPIYSTQSLTNPTVTFPWANNFDLVLAGGGGGGKAGQSGIVTGGGAGAVGGWSTPVTLTRAQMGSSNLAWTIGAGGGGGPSNGAVGSNGGGSQVVITGYGTITAGGGAGMTGNSGNAYGAAGPALGALTYNGYTYPGGAGGSPPSGWGGQPGGGGAGGNAAGLGNNNGGNGGNGIGYILCSM